MHGRASTGQGPIARAACGTGKVSFSPAISLSGSGSSSQRGSLPRRDSTDRPQTNDQVLSHPNHLSQPIPPRSSEPNSPGHTVSVQTHQPHASSGSNEVTKALELASWENPASVKIVVVSNFNPCCNTELKAYQGQYVTGLFQSGAWVYARALTGAEGYLPSQICALKPSLFRPPSSSGVSSSIGDDEVSSPGGPVGQGSVDDRLLHRGSWDQTDSGHVGNIGSIQQNGYHSEPERVSSRVTFAMPKTRDPWRITDAHGARATDSTLRQMPVSAVSGGAIHQWHGTSQLSPVSPSRKGVEDTSPGCQKNFPFPLANQEQQSSSAVHDSATAHSNKKRLIDRIKNFRSSGGTNIEVFSFDHSPQPSPRGSSRGQSQGNSSFHGPKMVAGMKESRRESGREDKKDGKKRKQAKKAKSRPKEHTSDTEVAAAVHIKQWGTAHSATKYHDSQTDSETVRHHIRNIRLTSAGSDTEEHTRSRPQQIRPLHLHGNGGSHAGGYSPSEVDLARTRKSIAIPQPSLSHHGVSDNVVTSFVLYDFVAQQEGQLSVTRGQQVHKFYNMEMEGRAGEAGWIFVLNPETKKKGFIPQACLQPLPSPLAASTVSVPKMAHDV